MTRPDCYLTDSLPQGFETDFRAWVTYDNMAARAHTPEQEAARHQQGALRGFARIGKGGEDERPDGGRDQGDPQDAQ